MLDIQLFRADKGGNPDLIRESQRRRCKDPAIVDAVIAKDNEFRQATSVTDNAKKLGNIISKAVGDKKKAKEADGEDLPIPDEITEKMRAGTLAADDLKALTILTLKSLSGKASEFGKECETKALAIEKERDLLVTSVGNIVHESVRATANEDENEVVRTYNCEGLKEERNGQPNHVDVMKRLGMDTGEAVTRLAGNRAYFLKGPLAQLHMAVINYAIQFLTGKGYTPIYPPFFLNQSAMSEVAELADFDDQLYKLTGDGGDKYLIATSEQPICAYHANQYYSDKDLPIMYAGYSTCFRKEVGSHGRDTLGIFRVHQFDKIEQFVVTSPDENVSWEMMEKMIGNAESFYQSLGLPYRVVKIVAGALNGAAAMKYDLEGWFPASGAFRELVSCSNCTDYQSRAIGARYGTGKTKAGTGATKSYVHMLNSTMCAATRVMCLICETFQTEEGIKVPEVLVPYLGGQTVLKYIAPAEEDKAKK